MILVINFNYHCIIALVSAPYFVFFEVLFKLGYRPQLRKEVEAEVEKDVAEFRAKRANKDK